MITWLLQLTGISRERLQASLDMQQFLLDFQDQGRFEHGLMAP